MSLSAKAKKATRTFKKARERAKAEGKGFSELPDGRYVGAFRKGEVGESANGRFQAMMAFKIMEGEYAGEETRKYSGLEDEDSQTYFAMDLQRLGYEMPDDSEALEPLFAQMLRERLVIRFSLKTKGEYQNMWFDKVLTNKDYDDEDDDGGVELPSDNKPQPFLKGTRVSAEIEGEDYEGEVAGCNDEKTEVYIEFDDGDKQYVPVEDVTLISRDPEPEPEPEDDGGLDVGDRVIAEIDGSEYFGEITLIEGNDATVKFDDGDIDTFDLDDLTAEEGDDGDDGDGDDPPSTEVKKDMSVEVKVGRETIEGVVTRVSASTGTINVKAEDGTIHKAIPADNIITIYDED